MNVVNENNTDLINVNSKPRESTIKKTIPVKTNAIKKGKEKTDGSPPPAADEATTENPKKERHYDVAAARNFMKQKRNERQQKAKLEKNKTTAKVKDRSEIKKKLDDLRNKQLSILKNSTKMKANELPEWVGLGSDDNNEKKEVPEPVSIFSEKNIPKFELSKAKSTRQNVPAKKKLDVHPTNSSVKQPTSFFVDVNFPAEFLTTETPLLPKEPSNHVIDDKTTVSRVKTPVRKVTSNILAITSKTSSVNKQPQKNDEINKIFQEEIKQGLEATNEFMQQVSEQMKLLTEHFTLFGNSTNTEPAGKSIAIQSNSFKDIAVQAFASSLSESSHGSTKVHQKETDDISFADEWKEILPAMMEELKMKKSGDKPQQTTILSELFCEEELSKIPDSIKSQELLTVVRRKLDFIEQEKAQEKNNLHFDLGIPDRDVSLGLLPLHEVELKNSSQKEYALIKESGMVDDNNLKKSFRELSEHSLNQNSLKIEIKDERVLQYQNNINGDGKSDTTISESLSTDPLKLPEEVDNLSITGDGLKKIEILGTSFEQRKATQDENMPIMSVKLDTNSIEGLHIQTSPLFESKKSRSRSVSSKSFSEIPEKISYQGTQSASKTLHNTMSKNDQSPRTLIEISENLRRSNSSRSNLSKISSIDDYKSIKESFEKLNSSKSDRNSVDNSLKQTPHLSNKSKKAKDPGNDIQERSVPMNKEILSENYEFNQNSRKNESMENIEIIKSEYSNCSSRKAYSERKIKERKYYKQNKHSGIVSNVHNMNTGRSLENIIPDYNQIKELHHSAEYKKKSKDVDSDHSVSSTTDNSQQNPIEVKPINTPWKCKNVEISGDNKIDCSQKNARKSSNRKHSIDDLRTISSDSQGFELLQPTPKVIRQHSSNSKRRTSSERNLQEMFIDKIPMSSVSSNSAQVGSLNFQELIMKEMENLDAVNTNLSHAIARNRVLSSENIVHFSSPSTSTSVCVGDNRYYPLQLSQSDTTNNQSIVSSGFEAGRDQNNGVIDDPLEDPSINLPKFSLRMLENLLIDEELRYRNQSSLLDLRYQAVLEKTQAELTMLSVEKAKHKAKGNEEILRNIKKRARGIILKCQQDFKEIKRLHEVGREASRDRILLIKSQIHLLKSHLNSNKYVQKFHSSNMSKNLKKSGHSPSKSNKFNSKSTTHFTTHANLESQKRELERREAMLAARRQTVEAVISWTRRVEDEEKRLKDVEKMIALSSNIRQGMKEGVDRGTSPLNLVSDPEFVANKTVESSASSSEHPADTKLNRKSLSEKSVGNYSDTFEQITMSEKLPRVKIFENNKNDSSSRRKTTFSIKEPLAPRPSTKRRHSSGSDESILYSQNETSETSDIEVRVSSLQQQLKQRKNELEILKKQHSKSQREKLRATEQALISQINAYDGYIEQLKNDIKQELDNGAIKVMKPQIKQPKVAERRKSELFLVAEKKKESELTKESTTSEDIDLSESAESVKTLIESPRVLEDAISKSVVEDSFKTDVETLASSEYKLESLELDQTDQNINSESNLIQNDNSWKSSTDFNESEVASKVDTEIGSFVSEKESKDTEMGSLVSEIMSKVDNEVESLEKSADDSVIPEIPSEKQLDSIVSKQESDNVNQIKESEVIPEIKESVSDIIKDSSSASTVSDNIDIKSEVIDEIHENKISEKDLNDIEEKENVISSQNESSQDTSQVLDEIEKESALKSEISSVANVDEVMTESLLKSFDLSDDKIVKSTIIEIEDDTKHESLDDDFETSHVSLSIEKDFEKNYNNIEVSINSNLSNKEQQNSDIFSNLEDSPISSLISEENVHLMSAALMRAIEATKEEVASDLEICNDKLTPDNNDQNLNDSNEDINEKLKSIDINQIKDISGVKSDTVESQNVLEEEIPEEIEQVFSPISDHNISSPNDKTFIINDDTDKNINDCVSEDVMLRMISDSLSDSERLWNLNAEEYRKIREETPFLTALQHENDLSNTVDNVSQHVFRNLFEQSVSDVLEVYFNKREIAFKAHLMEDEYHVPDFEYCEEPLKEAEEEKFWCNAFRKDKKETPPSQDEAEKLRLKQLQIEQEIEELEAAGMSGFYLREIPNKPPPPYTPPRLVKSRLTREVISFAVDICITALWESESDGLSNVRPPSTFLTDMLCSSSDVSVRDMIWDLCVELYQKALPPPVPPSPSWILVPKKNKLAQPLRSKEEVTSWCTRQAHIILGFERAVKKETMFVRWSQKKRDRVDKILLKENQEEESSWVDYSIEENIIKNRITDLITDEAISDATTAIVNAFLRKIPTLQTI